jgi:predicted metal-dependent TIM-barrel fold hydrolase
MTFDNPASIDTQIADEQRRMREAGVSEADIQGYIEAKRAQVEAWLTGMHALLKAEAEGRNMQ